MSDRVRQQGRFVTEATSGALNYFTVRENYAQQLKLQLKMECSITCPVTLVVLGVIAVYF